MREDFNQRRSSGQSTHNLSALLISDVGRYFCDPQWPHKIVRDEDIPPLEEKARQIAAFVHQNTNVPHIYTSWVIANGDAKTFNESQHIVQADPTKDLMIEKSDSSSFKNTPLDEKLKEKEIRHLYIIGFETSGCVRATALDAIERGYKVTVISDLCADHPDRPYLLEKGFIKDDELQEKIEQQRTGIPQMQASGVRFITAPQAQQELASPPSKQSAPALAPKKII